MRFVLLFIIRMYWLLPKRLRRPCIFKCSCSVHVYNEAKQNGVLRGLKALRERHRQCRAGYSYYKTPDGADWVILRDRTCVRKDVTNL